jgi:hypothetical protein
MEKTNPEPEGLTRRAKWWRWIVAILVVIAGAIVFIVHSLEEPSVMLSDGIRVFYVGSSRGMPQPPGVHGFTVRQPTYQHPSRSRDSRLRRWWQEFLDQLPRFLATRIPQWDYHRDDYPEWVTRHECELQLRVQGDFSGHQHEVFVVDESGWETRADEYIQGDDGRFKHGADHKSGWIRLASAFPRKFQTLRIRFRRWEGNATPEQLRARFADLVIPNPFYDTSPSAPAHGLPITMPFSRGTATLNSIKRDRVVGSAYGSLSANITIRRGSLLQDGYAIKAFNVTDSSGQFFDQNDGFLTCRDGRYTIGTDTAPWSDDPCWYVHMILCREEYSDNVEDGEKFRFENLPVPRASTVPLNREITKNGITLRIPEIGTRAAGGARFTVEGWPQQDRKNRCIIILDARDDRGRTHFLTPEGQRVRMVHSLDDATLNDPTFAVDLPPDAKSWELTILPETLSTLKFSVRPPSVQ